MTTSYRRRHFKVEQLPPEGKAWVDEQLSKPGPKLTYEQIAQEVVHRWGVKLNVSSICRYKKSFEHQSEKMAYVIQQAEKIMDKVKGSGLELGEVAQAMVVSDITLILAQGGHGPETLNKFGRTLALIGRAAAQQAQAKIRHGKAFKAFERRVVERMREEVAKDKELADRLEAIIADEAELIAKEAA